MNFRFGINEFKAKTRKIKDSIGKDHVLHSLGACTYLKVESANHIHFKFQFYNNRRICI